MSILQTLTLGAKQEFNFEVQKGFQTILLAVSNGGDVDKIIRSDDQDKANLKILKKQLGMERQELMLKQLMTKNNDRLLQNGNPNPNLNNIGNNYNKQKFDLVEKYNSMICIFLLYFIHEANWLIQPEYLKPWYDANGVEANYNDAQYVKALFGRKEAIPTGLPYDVIFQKIKKVLPFMSNMFMELIEDKFPTGTSVQVAEYQDLQERLNEAQLLGKKASSEFKKVKKITK